MKFLKYTIPIDGNLNTIQGAYSEMAMKMNYNASGNLVYAGKAEPGSLSASAVWQIKKLQYDTTTNDNISSILWASGNMEFDQVWNNRSSIVFL